MHDVAHSHSHAGTRRAEAAGSLRAALALTASYLLVEVVASFITGSLALLADAGHMLTDVGGIALSLVAIQLAQRPATPERTYGLHRAEILAALANGVVLIAMSGFILFEAYRRIMEPPSVQSVPMMLVAALGLVVNVAAMVALRRSRDTSLNLRGAYLELVSDAISSIGVMLAAGVMWATGWYYADPIVSVGIAVYIVPRTWRLLREAVEVLLEGTPSDVSVQDIRQRLLAVEGVEGVHDLHIWSLTSGMNALSVHVVRTAGSDWEQLLDRVHRAAQDSGVIHHATVQLEPPGRDCRETHL